MTGEEKPGWADQCTAACYDCLLSYSNQLDHRHLDRHLIRDYLLRLKKSELAPPEDKRSYDEQYRWLYDRTDPASSFEREFLDYLYRERLRLPDYAQYTPTSDIAVQPDFYYERNRVPGVCVFIDGPHHDEPRQAERDRQVREALRDQGYRVTEIKSGRPLAEQIREHRDVFGSD